jgi:hypothetical protein
VRVQFVAGTLVRDYVGVEAWGEEALQAMQSASRDAARTFEDLADIINFTVEQLVRQRFELPAVSVARAGGAACSRDGQSVFTRFNFADLPKMTHSAPMIVPPLEQGILI